jgi:DNA-binding PadR family transcriptional regulator
VLQALDAGCRHGFEIIEAVGVRSGTVYPVLRRLEEQGLVKSRWEPVREARDAGRPPRRYYELTRAADSLLERAREAFPADRHLPALGENRG